MNGYFTGDKDVSYVLQYGIEAKYEHLLEKEGGIIRRLPTDYSGIPKGDRNTSRGLADEEIARNTEAALSFFRQNNYSKAFTCAINADHDNVLIELILGTLFLTGAGVKKSFSEAYYWLRRASDNGSSYASSQLADMYASYKISAENESAYGTRTCLPSILYFRMARHDFPLRDVINKLDLMARFDDGTLIFRYEIEYVSMCEEKRWYYKSLAVIDEEFYDGTKVERDEIARLASEGEHHAQAILSVLFEYGIGGFSQSIVEGLKYEKMLPCEGRNHSYAFRDLLIGIYYLNGIGLRKDDILAETHLRRAAEGGSSFADACLRLLQAEKDEKEGVVDDNSKAYHRLLKKNDNERHDESVLQQSESIPPTNVTHSQGQAEKDTSDDPWTSSDTKWLLVGLTVVGLVLLGAYQLLMWIIFTIKDFLFG